MDGEEKRRGDAVGARVVRRKRNVWRVEEMKRTRDEKRVEIELHQAKLWNHMPGFARNGEQDGVDDGDESGESVGRDDILDKLVDDAVEDEDEVSSERSALRTRSCGKTHLLVVMNWLWDFLR